MRRERAGRFGLSPWNPMRFEVNNGSYLRHILRCLPAIGRGGVIYLTGAP